MKNLILTLALLLPVASFSSSEMTIDLTKTTNINVCKNDIVALGFSKPVSSVTSGDVNQLTATLENKSNVIYLKTFQKNAYVLFEYDTKAYALQVQTKDCKNISDINANPKIFRIIETLDNPIVYQGSVIQRAFLDPYDSYGKKLKVQLKEDVKDKNGNVILKSGEKLEATVSGINLAGLVQMKLSNSDILINAQGVPYNSKNDELSRGPAELSQYLKKKQDGFNGFIYFPQDK